MKQLPLFLIGILCFYSNYVSAQIIGFNYQATAWTTDDGDTLLLSSQDIDLQIEILSWNDSLVYKEVHSTPTSPFGTFSVIIGNGTNINGNFSEIDWGNSTYRLQVQIDGKKMGEPSPILSVPTSIYAEKAGNGYWEKSEDDIFFEDGKVGIGMQPINTLSVNGLTNLTHPTSSTVLKLRAGSNAIGTWISSFDEVDSKMWTINMGERTINDRFEIISKDNSEVFIIDQSGKIGIGTTPINTLTVNGLTNLSHTNSSTLLKLQAGSEGLDTQIKSFEEDGTTGMWTINMGDRKNNNRFGIFSQEEGEYKLWIDHENNTNVRVLEIHGGADLAEPFDISNEEAIPKGSVVVIDDRNPGQLILSSEPYDPKVAGVISGAGNIKPGITLQQDGVMEGNQLVALAGRVYVKASTINGTIKPGDLITSSPIKGYAMKATNKRKRQGAVIGKAMTELKEKDGLVLVLIQPQ